MTVFIVRGNCIVCDRSFRAERVQTGKMQAGSAGDRFAKEKAAGDLSEL